MSRKTSIALSIALSGLGVSRASAQIFQPGNFWPNPDLSVAAAPGVDQVYSAYNTPFYTPNVTGDTNPRPNGWHRGGNDFGVTTTEFRAAGSTKVGRQSQTWIRTSQGWKIASAHVSYGVD